MTNETLEEAAEHNYPNGDIWTEEQAVIRRLAFKNGAKWQQENIYNDVKVFTEELMDKIDSFEYSVNQNSYISDYVKEWFEQFKKDKL
jgi:hypothetical protein